MLLFESRLALYRIRCQGLLCVCESVCVCIVPLSSMYSLPFPNFPPVLFSHYHKISLTIPPPPSYCLFEYNNFMEAALTFPSLHPPPLPYPSPHTFFCPPPITFCALLSWLWLEAGVCVCLYGWLTISRECKRERECCVSTWQTLVLEGPQSQSNRCGEERLPPPRF